MQQRHCRARRGGHQAVTARVFPSACSSSARGVPLYSQSLALVCGGIGSFCMTSQGSDFLAAWLTNFCHSGSFGGPRPALGCCAFILQSFWLFPGLISVLPVCCQCVASVLPVCCRCVASVLPVCLKVSWHFLAVLSFWISPNLVPTTLVQPKVATAVGFLQIRVLAVRTTFW